MAGDEALAEQLTELLAGEAGLTRQRMFGGVGFLIDGHLAVSASGRGGLLVRVPPERTDELVARPHAGPFRMRGRELTGWLHVDTETLADTELREWVGIGVGHARSLPPKRR